MDTHCKECPNLKIKTGQGWNCQVHDVNLFYNTREEMQHVFNSSFSLKELDVFYLYFDSDDSGAKLFMDGLEFLPTNAVQYTDSNEIYLPPSKDFYPIYLFEQGYYPFRVGMYEIQIQENGNEYFALLHIKPKHLNDEEWTLLKDDLEKEVRGLAQDLIRKNIGFGSEEFQTLPVEVLQKFLIINKYANKLLGSLMDLKDKPNFRIEKKYVEKELYKAKQIDAVTLRNYLSKGVEEDKYLIPERYISYDLQENRWLKKIIETYENHLNKFLDTIYNSKEAIKKEIYLLQSYNFSSTEVSIKTELLNQLVIYENTAKRILKISNIVKLQDWYNEITPLKDGFIPHVLVMDARYCTLYNLYRDLKNQKFDIEIDKNYSYAWKNTYKLYEIWCFIKIYKFLMSEKMSFAPQSSIVISKAKSMLIPMIEPGTCLSFQKGTMTLKLYYDKTLPSTSKETICATNPIYTSARHNRPDARLDIYVDSIYMRSIIFEFKYRAIKNFWNKNNQTTSYDQIMSYRDSTKSLCIENYKPSISKELRPVKEVWVFHPTIDNFDNAQTLEKFDEGVKLIRLRPGENAKEIVSNLSNTIEEIVNIVNDED